MLRLISWLVFVGTIVQVMVLLGSTPVADREVRKESIDGGWRIAVGSSLFDRGEYLFQIGYGYANADDSLSQNTDPDDPMALANERAALAVDYLTQSLNLDPGNAHAWAALAWSEASLGNLEVARKAMQTSWAIAPHNIALAPSRIEFVALIEEELLFEAEFADGDLSTVAPLTEAELRSTDADMKTLAKRAYPLAQEIAEDSEILMSMLPPQAIR